MAFTIPLTFDWLEHRLFAARRILFRQSPFYFIDKNPALAQIKNQNNLYIPCPVCGFSMAEFGPKNGWSVRSCSATGFNQIIGSSSLGEWLIEVNNKKPDEGANSNHLSIKLK